MGKLIYADDLKKAALVYDLKRFKNPNRFVADCIANTPAVDAEPVKHGRWIDDKDSIIGELIERNCSLCGQRMTSVSERKMPYCPNCGAKMDGEA